MASPTVNIGSAASSGISQPNSASKAITSSTVSRLSAPRSSMKLALSVTFSASTPKCSTTIFFTRSPISLIAATSRPSNWARSVSALEPLRYGLVSGVGSSGRERTPGDDWNRYAAPAKPKSGYHTSNALTSTAAPPRDRPSLSNHRHPAVHVQRLAGDVSGFFRSEIDRSRRHVRPPAQAARRDSGEDRLPLLVVEPVGHSRGDQTGRDAVRGDAAFGVFGGDRLDHADHAGLGRRVIALAGVAGNADHRTDADDAAKAAAHHAAQRRAGEPERRRQIDRNHLVPVLVS